jgi:hypothetical protein
MAISREGSREAIAGRTNEPSLLLLEEGGRGGGG